MTDQPEEFLRYDKMVERALRSVVKESVKEVIEHGLINDHHFYITFITKAPGVKMADHLVERFPHEMTIVIQHQFWDLEVHDGHFEVVLKFAGVPQHLFVPYSAVSRFVDPSVNFGLTFENGSGGDNDVLGPVTDVDDASDVIGSAEEGDTVVNLDAFRKR